MGDQASELLLGVDIGAGSGAKIGLFDGALRPVAESRLSVERYGDTAAALVDALGEVISSLLADHVAPDRRVTSLGVACPGFLATDGSLLATNNLPFLNGAHLGRLLQNRLGLPAVCRNDADLGAMAEWSRRRCELLYWVFGGGWGGAWVSADGMVQHPSVDWDGNDASLHYTNEPGYAIPLRKGDLARWFEEADISFEQFLRVCRHDAGPGGQLLAGPCGRDDAVRAEVVVSGAGRLRIFRAAVAGAQGWDDELSEEERPALADPGEAGRVIDLLGHRGVPAAVNTDSLFGRALGEAAAIMMAQAVEDGCPASVMVILAGKPSRAMPLFEASARATMAVRGLRLNLQRSCVEEEGLNANLLGAAFVGMRVAANGGPADV